MQTKIRWILGIALAASLLTAVAQNAPSQSTNSNWVPGPMWKLTPEQRAARIQQVQTALADLKAKRDQGTITDQEKAWLERMEQAGGLCINGVPRGGQGAGMGPRNGTGPRAQAGLCPMMNGAATAVTPAPGLGRGRGSGMGWGGGMGRGFGPRNGTGPRAQMGTCPLLNPPPTTK